MLLIDAQDRPQTTEPTGTRDYRAERRSQRLRDAGILFGIIAIVAGIVLTVLVAPRGPLGDNGERSEHDATAAGGAATVAPAPTAAEAKGVKFEKFERVDPALPAIPPGAVKRFEVDVYEHVTKVSDDLAPTEVWSYAINGVEHRGTGVSEPMVVEVGDRVRIDLVNGSSERMHVRMPHSIDYHSSEVNPGEAFKTIPPGGRHSFEFTAKHPGVFMYHCATDPVLHHTGAGMVGAMIVKAKNLAPVNRELWINQQEFYIGKPGGLADMQKMKAKQPDVIAFNGYAAQYKKDPIAVKKGERIRMFVLNSGPSIWSAFHVIGTVFDKTNIEGLVGHDAQTVNLAPSQGGWVEFTLDEEGTYPFVTHAFGDMVKGSVGVLATEHAPQAGMKH
jgi:nitrite reductase (NO-forming)